MTWGWLGVAIQNVTPAIAKSLGLDPDHPTGALVASVTADSPAARAGIKQGDVITAAGGHEIKTVHDLPRLVASTPVGSKLQLTIVRDGKQKTVEASIGEMPQNVASAEREAAQPGSGKAANALGMELLPLDPQLRKELKVPKDLNSVKGGGGSRRVLLLLNRRGMSQFVGLSVENNRTAGSSRRVRDNNSAGLATAFGKRVAFARRVKHLVDF